jgi:metallo-beta-lactamase class B
MVSPEQAATTAWRHRWFIRRFFFPLLLKTTALAAVAALVQGCAQTPPSGQASQAPSDATVATHVAAATRAAGTDLGPLLGLCKPAPAAQPPQAELDRGLRALIDKPAPPPGKAFDNLYFVGADWVSAWAVKTSDGIILIDALNNQVEAAALIEGGMRKLGLDPAQIRYVVVTHGHGDHYGGAPYLAQKYGARVVMSEADWTMTETKLEFATPVWGAPPKRGARDLSVKDGDRLTLGDTTVTLYVTPGHTMGTISPVFDVSAGGQKHRALLWGGTAFNFGKNVPRLGSYIDATRRMGSVVAGAEDRRAGVEPLGLRRLAGQAGGVEAAAGGVGEPVRAGHADGGAGVERDGGMRAGAA